ncbi:hypothetical protein [Rarobacter faecitabidus]|uniref:Uncharacterized protein n=1 Tax=Rarobacter faecitabidus TaxID=13243 RepID=A0A542ZNU4_RARFA|nr:hypothetical protein [Rarobacter faecitabidus]TQL62044.1 hypothetical protein FB461_1677 [Rarobacter faecitabidus]
MDEELTEDQRLVFMALDAFKATGLAYTVLMRHGQYGIRVDSIGLELWLTSLIEDALELPESEWPNRIDYWLATVVEVIEHGPNPRYSEDEVRTAIRTRLFRADEDPEAFSYARPFADGLVLGLALDSPRTVANVTSKLLGTLPLGVDALFELGQVNTDQETIDDAFEIVEEECHGLIGDSHFVASRAANLPSLLRDYIGNAPYGVAFGVPNRHTLLYRTLDKETWPGVTGIASLVDGIAHREGDPNPGGVLSSHLYYWAPECTIETLAGRFTDVDGKTTLTIRPGNAFTQFVMRGFG